MPDDNYAYQSIPLPDLSPFGGNAINNALSSSPPQAPDIPVAAYGTVDSPFGDPSVNAGTGGVPIPTPVLFVTNVEWDADAGALVITFSDDSTSTVPFSDCPPSS